MVLRRIIPVAVGLALTLASAQHSSAQTVSYDNRCTTTGLIACFSISITTTPIGTGTGVVINVSNWQGAAGYPSVAPSFLNQITFFGMTGTGTTSNYVTSASTTGSTAVAVGGATSWFTQLDAGQPNTLRLGGTGLANNLAGCVAPVVNTPVPNSNPTIYAPTTTTQYWSTCGGGSLVLSFAIPTLWSIDPSQTVVLSLFGDGFAQNRCILGGTNTGCTPFTPPPVSVPEPEGWLLMASGLLGLAFVRRRRKGTQA